MICAGCGKEINKNQGKSYWIGVYCKGCAEKVAAKSPITEPFRYKIRQLKNENRELKAENHALQSANAALRARLGKFDDLHINMGEKIYIIQNGNEIIERFICGVHVLSTEIIFVTTIKQDYKPCNKKRISERIVHAFESCFGLIPLRDFGERAFVRHEDAKARLAKSQGAAK